MLNELLIKEKELQKHLTNEEYSFIGPLDKNMLADFIKKVNNIAPIVGFERRLVDSVGNKEAVLQVLRTLPRNLKLQIYILPIKEIDGLFLYDTFEAYCLKHNLEI